MFAWVVAQANVAPLFHSRFMIVLLLSLILLVPTMAAAMPNCLLAVSFILSAVVFSEATTGPIRRLSSGQPFPRIEHEEWREAAAYLKDRTTSQDVIYLASRLIETDTLLRETNGNEAAKEYLTFPLRTIYSAGPARLDTLSYAGLFTGPEQMRQFRTNGGGWIIFRGDTTRADLMFHAINAQFDGHLQIDERFDCYNMTVFHLRIVVK